MADPIPRPHEEAGTGAEDVPPGATRKAWRRDENLPGGPPGSGAGPRHMSGDPGDGNELSDEDDVPRAETEATVDEGGSEDATAYSGHAGGAVGGTPAGGRATGGNIHGGLNPGGVHRGDSTIGTNPDAPKGASKKRRKK